MCLKTAFETKFVLSPQELLHLIYTNNKLKSIFIPKFFDRRIYCILKSLERINTMKHLQLKFSLFVL